MSAHVNITIHNLSAAYTEKLCFSGFTHRIEYGQRIALVGDNGTGKSTCLKLLAGLLMPSQGAIKTPPSITIGYLPQDMSLDEGKTVVAVAKEYVQSILNDLSRFQKLAESYTQTPDGHLAYNDLLDRLMAIDAFSLEQHIDVLCSKLGLQPHRHKKVSELSGGQRMHLGLVRILANRPHMLLLDEPTNHLDEQNRKVLIDFLDNWPGTALIASHDQKLLEHWPNQIWQFAQGQIEVFKGNYRDFVHKQKLQYESTLRQRELLFQERRSLKQAWQDEQKRAASSRRKGEKKYADAPGIVRNAARQRGEQTHGRHKLRLRQNQDHVSEQLKELVVRPQISPRFQIDPGVLSKGHVIIDSGQVSYGEEVILQEVQLCLRPGDRLAITGTNGSGKSTLTKAISNSVQVIRHGQWQCPKRQDIGILDQDYSSLDATASPFETIKKIRPEWSSAEVWSFLNEFLLRKPEDVHRPCGTLSGGEKAKLCLAQIAARTPAMVILDEVTNNLDLKTRDHVIEVMRAYPGTVVAISHDIDFLHAIGIEDFLEL